MLNRFPFLPWAGAGLLGWVAGGIIASDPYVAFYLQQDAHALHYIFAAAGLVITLLLGLALHRRSGHAVEA